MKKISLLLALCCASPALYATCNSIKNTIFQCTTDNNKVIQLCDHNKTIQYSFGKAKQTPELSIAINRSQARTWQWQGFGRAETYSVTVPNGKTLYRVFSSFDKLEQRLYAGVEVQKNQQLLATVYCNQNKTIINHLIGVDLPPDE